MSVRKQGRSVLPKAVYFRWLLAGVVVVTAWSAGVTVAATSNELWDFGVATQRVEDLKRVSAYLNGLASEPLPKGATAEERTDNFALAHWCRNTARKMHHLARGWGVLLRRIPKPDSENQALLERLQEMNRSFSVQYLDMVARANKELAAFQWTSQALHERQVRATHLLATLQ